MSQTKKAHRHMVKESRLRAFTGCVIGTLCDASCNEMAHGGVSHKEYCRCGAERLVNSNQGHREVSGWYED